jgi:hypothetical protein
MIAVTEISKDATKEFLFHKVVTHYNTPSTGYLSKGEWGDHMEVDFKETEYEGVDWIYVAQGVQQWQAVVNVVMKLKIP